MPLHVDSYFAMGKTHTVCQDYADTLNSVDTAVLAVSDGCSSSPHTDFGARFLVRTGMRDCTFGPPNAGSWSGILQTSKRAQEAMGLPFHSLDATLLLAHVDQGRIYLRMWGDGVVFVKFKDQSTHLYEVQFDDNTPSYLSYLDDFQLIEKYQKLHGKRSLTTYEGTDIYRVDEPVTLDNYNLSWDYELSHVEQVFLFSDGVSSFREKANSSTAWKPIPLMDVVTQIIDVKNPNGQFMVRRMRKFLYEFCPKNNWIHEDDVSVAALMNVD